MLAAFLFALFAAGEYEGAGIQLFKGNQVLLVQGIRSGKWGFPKGNRELIDLDWKGAALREVAEETSYIYDVDYTLCDKMSTQWGSRIYWKGSMITDRAPIYNVTEHSDIGWFSKEEIAGLRLTKDAEEWIQFDFTTCS